MYTEIKPFRIEVVLPLILHKYSNVIPRSEFLPGLLALKDNYENYNNNKRIIFHEYLSSYCMNKTSHFPADVPAFLCVKCFSQPAGNLLSATIMDRRGPKITSFYSKLKLN